MKLNQDKDLTQMSHSKKEESGETGGDSSRCLDSSLTDTFLNV